MHIEAKDDDHDRFIEIVRSIVEAVVDRQSPEILRVVRVDNWFGEKWRGFAGKMLGALGVGRGRLRIPPFVPSRVDSESLWMRRDSVYAPDPDFDLLHKRISSEENLKRYFDQYCPDTIAVWFSSQSASNGRGSIMVYSNVGMDRTISWYIELTATKNWEVSVANGVTKSEFLKLVASKQTEAEQGSAHQSTTAP